MRLCDGGSADIEVSDMLEIAFRNRIDKVVEGVQVV